MNQVWSYAAKSCVKGTVPNNSNWSVNGHACQHWYCWSGTRTASHRFLRDAQYLASVNIEDLLHGIFDAFQFDFLEDVQVVFRWFDELFAGRRGEAMRVQVNKCIHNRGA